MATVFLSYSRTDQAFVEELYRRLTRDGVDCFFDKESIKWGENWVLALEKGVAECEVVVCLLSPEFCESEWSRVERTSAMVDDPLGLKRRVRPLLRRDCAIPSFLKPVQYLDVRTDALFEENYPTICRELGGSPTPEREPPERGALPPEQPLPKGSHMPRRSMGERFVGRIDALWELYDLLFREDVAVVSGIGVVAGTGGLGKTQLAIEFVWRFGYLYPGGVWWVEADQGLGATIALVAKHAEVELDEKAPEAEQAVELWGKLRGKGAALLVLDNFPEQGPLTPFLPSASNVQTLVTTRRQDLLPNKKLGLRILNAEAALALLNSGERQFGAEAAELLEALGGLPLAIELTASFLNERQEMSPSAVLAEMKRRGEMTLLSSFAKKYRDELPSGHEADVAATFQLSWDLLEEQERQTLRVMAELAPVAVPRRFLRIVLDVPAGGFDDPLGEALAELKRLSLVELDEEAEPSMHRLVQSFVRHVGGDGDLRGGVAKALLAEMARANDDADQRSFEELEALIPHAEAVAEAEEVDAEIQIDLLSYSGTHQRAHGRFRLSLHARERSLAKAQASFEPGHPSIAIRQSNLALVLRDLGELEEARDLLREALQSDQASFEPGHPSIAIRQSNLATVLKDLGELEEARDLLREALQSNQASFEPGHPSIAIRQSNLALVLKDLGELEEARDLLREALQSGQASFEPGHPSIAIRQSNLALVLKDLGELEEARDLLREALQSNQASFEPGHPSIAISQSNLALVLKGLGELEEARDLLREALQSDQASFEPGHPSIAISQSNLAMVLQDLGELVEARDLLRQAYASLLDKFGADHPNTKTALGNLRGVEAQMAPGE